MIYEKSVILVTALVVIGSLLVFADLGEGADVKTEEKARETVANIEKTQNEEGIKETDKPNVVEKHKEVLKKPTREKAPDFILVGISGENVRLSDYRGKVIILDFWDTWCSPCKIEIPGFVKLQKEWGDKDVQIIGIAFAKQGLKAVQNFADNYCINYPVGICDQQTYDSYGPITGIPTTFIIDREGGIYKKYIGFRPEETFAKDIKILISE
jgi:peroxiredoxin